MWLLRRVRNTPVGNIQHILNANEIEIQTNILISATPINSYFFFPSVPPYHRVGCFLDKPRRAIPHSGKNFHYGTAAERINLCASLAARRGHDTFGVQYGGQCFTGPHARKTYRKYGHAKRGCRRDGLGGTWRNHVYFIGKLI